jgi:hypothetical protein
MNYLKTFLPYLFGNKKGKTLDFQIPNDFSSENLSFEESLMFHALGNTLNQYVNSLDLINLSKKDTYQLFNFIDFLKTDLQNKIQMSFRDDLDFFKKAITSSSLETKALQELLNFKNSRLSVFVILKKDRKIPGLLLIRDASGKFLTLSNKSLWSIPILGLSSRDLPFHHSNGHTPTGVYTIDSVMPEANNYFEFGEFRRLIVNFIGESPNEGEILKNLPKSHQNKAWWWPSVVGRVLGRSLLRIHGSGRSNLNPFTTYFPFVPTSGCLATNEVNLFGLFKSQDQRLLLDALVSAMNLPKNHENESKIHGLLYVIEFDGTFSALSF